VRPHLKRWTGVYAGWVLSSEIANPGCRRRPASRKDKTRCATTSQCTVTLRSRRPHACIETPCARTERPQLRPRSRRDARRNHKCKSGMNVAGESSGRIVLTKCPNKARRLAAEGMEGRRLAKEIRRQGPELDTVPAEPGALYCRRSALIELGQRRYHPRWEPCALCGLHNYVASSQQTQLNQ
jgi:hypothetical protein